MNFTPAQVNQMSNLALAHVGDGAYELMCRTYLALKGDKTVLKLCKHRPLVLYHCEAFRIIDLKERKGLERAYYKKCRKIFQFKRRIICQKNK